MALTAIRGGLVVTVDPERRIIPDGGVLIEGDSIAWVGPSISMPLVRGARIVEAAGRVVMPGLVNAHTHVAQTLLRGGLSHSRRLYDWLLNVVCPGLAQYGPEDHRSAIRLYAAEAIHSGITTIVTNEEPDYTDSERATRNALEAFAETGLRVVYARMFRDRLAPATADLFREERARAPELADVPTVVPLDRTLAELERLGRAYGQARNARVVLWPSPATTAATSPEALRRTADLAETLGTRWALHLAETTLESEIRGVSPVRYLDDLGILGNRLLAAHCVHIDQDDIALLARRRVNVVTLPVSNCYLGSGIAPVLPLHDAGVTVAIGTDDANCNDSVNLFTDMKFLALIHRGIARDPAVLSPEHVLDMATIDGARALGWEDRIGSIEVGKRADVIVCRLDRPQTTPVHDVVATLLFQAYGSEVETVLVDGEVLLQDGRLARADEAEICRDAQRRSEDIVTRSGLRARRDTPGPQKHHAGATRARASGAADPAT